MSEQPKVRVAVVNDYEIVVAGIAAVLREHEDRIEVVELDSRMTPVSDVDVVLYDTFGQLQGSALKVEELLASGSGRLLVFSWNLTDELVVQSLGAGASGYVSKGSSSAELADAVLRVHAGERVVPTAPPDEHDDRFGTWPGFEEGLSARESEVLALICQGLSNDDIAERAFIGLNTVKTHIKHLYQKIGVDSRTRALLWGIDHGFRPDRSRHFPA